MSKQKIRATMIRISEEKAQQVDDLADQLSLKNVDIHRMALDLFLAEFKETGKLPHVAVQVGGGR